MASGGVKPCSSSYRLMTYEGGFCFKRRFGHHHSTSHIRVQNPMSSCSCVCPDTRFETSTVIADSRLLSEISLPPRLARCGLARWLTLRAARGPFPPRGWAGPAGSRGPLPAPPRPGEGKLPLRCPTAAITRPLGLESIASRASRLEVYLCGPPWLATVRILFRGSGFPRPV